MVSVGDAAPEKSSRARPASNFSESLVGTRFAGFDVLGIAGRGGMGVVFKAQHAETGAVVALKVLPVLTRRDREPVRRFLAEARVLARLNHPNITRIHSMGRRGHMYYLATEYIRGRTLAKLIDSEHGITPQQALLVVRGVAEALRVAHEHGIVHRDIKSDNIMIDHEGEVKVLDFGIAQDLNAKRRITVGDVCLGNPEYCSPEQLSTGRMDARTDVYSLGIVLYEMLAGEVPHHGMSTMQLFLTKRKKRLPSLARRIPGAPRNFRRLVKRMLAPNPEKRFASMEALIKEIEAVRPTLGDFGRTCPAKKRAQLEERRRSTLLSRVMAHLF